MTASSTFIANPHRHYFCGAGLKHQTPCSSKEKLVQPCTNCYCMEWLVYRTSPRCGPWWNKWLMLPWFLPAMPWRFGPTWRCAWSLWGRLCATWSKGKGSAVGSTVHLIEVPPHKPEGLCNAHRHLDKSAPFCGSQKCLLPVFSVLQGLLQPLERKLASWKLF